MKNKHPIFDNLLGSVAIHNCLRAGQSLSNAWAWWHLRQDALQTVSRENTWSVTLECLALVSREPRATVLTSIEQIAHQKLLRPPLNRV